MVKNWYKRTPKNFRFTAKLPKIITHDKRLRNIDEDQLDSFFKSISELKEKLLTLLIQLPPSLRIVEGLEALRNILPHLNRGFRYVPPIVTSDFVYVRFIGDRSIQEKDFGQIQIDRIKEMKKIARNFKDDTNEGNLSKVKFAIVAANNHYAGFGPGTVNIFRQLLGLEEVKWGDEYVSRDDLGKSYDESMNNRVRRTTQTSLDFFK